jgi:hypothetical protein
MVGVLHEKFLELESNPESIDGASIALSAQLECPSIVLRRFAVLKLPFHHLLATN